MPETPDLFNEVALLRDQVEDMAKSVSALTRQTGLREDVLAAMAKDPLLASIFLLVDGVRTQNQIVAALKANGDGGSQATVSRKLDLLIEDHDLVRITTRAADGNRYVHTQLAKDLKIKRALDKSAAMPPATGKPSARPAAAGTKARLPAKGAKATQAADGPDGPAG